MAILSTLESTTLDETIKCTSKMVDFHIKKKKSIVGQSQACNLRTTHSSVLKVVSLIDITIRSQNASGHINLNNYTLLFLRFPNDLYW